MRTARRLAHIGLALGIGLGLAAPGLVAAAPAHAAGIVVVADAAKKKTPKVTLKLSKATQTYAKASAKAKASVTYGKKRPAGKVAFYDGKKKLKTVTLKRGAASYQLPKSLLPGKHSLKAKYVPSKSAAKTYKSKTSATKRLTVKATRHGMKLGVSTNPSSFQIGDSFRLTITLSDATKSAYPKPTGTATVSVFGFMDSQTYTNVKVVRGKATIACSYLTYAGPKTVQVTFTPTDKFYKKQTLKRNNAIHPAPITTPIGPYGTPW